MKAKRYTWQSSDPMHPSKRRVIYHHTFSKMFMLTGNHLLLSLGGNVFTIVLPTQMHFSQSYLIAHEFTSQVEGSCMEINISITSANCNHQSCKPWCIYQVLKFPNYLPNSYSGVQSFLRLSSAWSSCYMWNHQMLLTYSKNYLNQKL